MAFQAMQTGHAVMSTFHASSVEKLIQRLTGDPINVPRTYVDTLNVIVICRAVALPNGDQVRRVTSVSEIISYDSSSGLVLFRGGVPLEPLYGPVRVRRLPEQLSVGAGHRPTEGNIPRTTGEGYTATWRSAQRC